MRLERGKSRLEWIKAIGIGIVVAIFLRTFFFSIYVVDGESMMPTLQDGNLVIINKLHVLDKTFKRGDIIVFHANKREDYVKRIIGLPGDTIIYRNDVLYLNGKKYDEPYLHKYKLAHQHQM